MTKATKVQAKDFVPQLNRGKAPEAAPPFVFGSWRKGQSKYPFKEMKVGDSFTFPPEIRPAVKAALKKFMTFPDTAAGLEFDFYRMASDWNTAVCKRVK